MATKFVSGVEGILSSRPVVILSERPKEEMDDELRASLRGVSLEWHTRMGFPHSVSDLQRVAAGQAKNVILLNPDQDEVDTLSMIRTNF